MGLSSVFSTAISGLQASETTIDVAGNNVANANTIGFKASHAVFATQFLQTLGLGSAPSSGSGGTNPRQTGLGTQVASIAPDFTQGTLEISSSPSDLAIQGDGFFIVQANNGEQLYTRNGKFQVNSENQLTAVGGERLLGYGVDTNYIIQRTSLQSLTIPVGAAAVAKATENVYLEGTLPPTGNVATTAQIIASQSLGDAAFTSPPAGTDLGLAAVPGSTTALLAGTTGSLTPSSVYGYKIVFADGPLTATPPGTESQASVAVSITLAAGEDSISLSGIPTAPTGTYSTRRIYRTEANGSEYKLVGEITDNTTAIFDDTTADGSLGATLDTQTISGNYSYYVVFANATGGPGNGVESRPSPLAGPLNVVNGRIQLTDIPVDSSGQWSTVRIYRNLAANDSEFHYVSEFDMGTTTFTDNATDAQISGNAEIDLVGPRANTNTLLVNLLRRTDTGNESLFSAGSLQFTGTKGGRTLDGKSLDIDGATTVLDLLTFMEQAMGIQKVPGPDPTNPIPADSSSLTPGGSMTANGQIRLVGNNGVDNALSIGLSGFQLTTSSGTSQVDLQFGITQEAVGTSAVADFVAYDSLGIPLNVRITTVLESRNGTQSVYRWFADSGDNDPLTGAQIAVGTGLIVFDGEGRFLSASNDTVSIDRRTVPSSSPLAFDLDFSNLSGLAASSPSLAVTRQDGFPPGKLSSYIIGEDGVIRGVFDNGTQRDLGQIVLARFANPAGMEQRGRNLFAGGVNSGLPVTSTPASQGVGSIISGAVELSNTDIGQSLIQLIAASTQYRGNARVITAAQQLLDELLNLRR